MHKKILAGKSEGIKKLMEYDLRWEDNTKMDVSDMV
jgi:hypothetical protein